MNKRGLLLILGWVLSAQLCFAQHNDTIVFNNQTIISNTTDSSTLFKKRLSLVTKLQTLGYGGSLLALNQAWYANYPRSSFHFYNDGGEWLKMDKVGHAYTAYLLSRIGHTSWQWAGASPKKAILYASLTGIGYQTIIETLDGFSSQWGWSWNDMAANTLGTGIWASQQWAWGTQKIRLKFSAHYNKYTDPQLEARTNQYFGSFLPERLLKDYNAQTYWLSANVHSFLPQTPAPKWLNIAIGYGAENMFGGYKNSWTTSTAFIDRPDIKRYPQWYLSLDVDFEKIPTKNKAVKSLLFVLNAIKFPAPTLLLSNGKISSQWLYY